MASTTSRVIPRSTVRRILVALLVALPIASLWTIANQPGRTALVPGDRVGEIGTLVLVTAGLLAARRLRGLWPWTIVVVASFGMAAMRFLGAHWLMKAQRPYRGLTWFSPVEFLVDWVVMGIAAAVALRILLRRRGADATADETPRPRLAALRVWLTAFFVQLVCWLPYALVYWPGIVGRDSWSSIIMGTGIEPMSNHHPVLFSLYVGWCMQVAQALGGGTTMGVAVFAFSQAALVAAALAVCVVWVRARAGRWAGWAALVFVALDPAIALWSITMHKDTLFVVWMTLLAVLLSDVARRGLGSLREHRMLMAFAALLLAVSFTRNNGPYIALAVVAAVSVLALPALLTPRRSGLSWWRVPIVGAVVIALVLLVQGPGYRAAGVIPSSRAESAGLQLHQVGWAVRYGTVTPEQEQTLSQLMPLDRWRALYAPTIVDSVKFAPEFNREWLNQHPDEFTALWIDLMGSNAGGYVKAWYGLSGGFLDPGRLLFRMDPGTKRGSRGLITVHDRDLIGPRLGLDRLPQKTVPRVATAIATAPGVNLAYCTPALVWLCVLACGAALVRRRPVAMLPFVPLLGLVATLMIASPLTDYRYLAAGHVGLPVLLVVLWRGAHPAARLPWAGRRVRGKEPLSLTDG